MDFSGRVPARPPVKRVRSTLTGLAGPVMPTYSITNSIEFSDWVFMTRLTLISLDW